MNAEQSKEEQTSKGHGTGSILVDRETAAKLLSCSLAHLWRMTRDGHLPFVRLGRSVRYRIESLRSWAARAESVEQSQLPEQK